MKKRFLLLAFCLLFALTACSKGGAIVGAPKSNLVEAVMPADIASATSYSSKTEEDIMKGAEKAGYNFTEVKKNDDGSVSFKMKKSDLEELHKTLHSSFQAGTKELLLIGDGKIFPHIKSITESDDFQKCTVVTSEVGPALNDESLASFYFMTAGEYNTFEGEPYKEVICEFVNELSNQVVNTVSSNSYWKK